MPNQTFFNLPEEKRALLIQSAKKEFSRVPLSEASIANIIKNARIPRGSFYQYFEDKEDAFYYILEEQMKLHHHFFFVSLKKNDGDLFESFIEIFQHMLKEFENHENVGFFRNVFLNMNYKMESKFIEGFNKNKLDEQFSGLIEDVDMKILNISSKEEVVHVIRIIASVTTNNLMQHFAKKISYDDALKNYTLEMNLLKKGLCKNVE
ncbi:MAG TPA: TetR/AcrR family transcriptional regulator [Virgibacillus sp.]|nr:TetR/AcrR family transcriptional regulator [Virgibacillus sp.]